MARAAAFFDFSSEQLVAAEAGAGLVLAGLATGIRRAEGSSGIAISWMQWGPEGARTIYSRVASLPDPAEPSVVATLFAIEGLMKCCKRCI
jgi:hypothetical protein